MADTDITIDYFDPSITTPKPTPHTIWNDITSRRFDKLLVLGFSHYTVNAKGKPKRWWLCLCECGYIKAMPRDSIPKFGACGQCLPKPPTMATRMPEYKVWQGMKKRCQNANSPDFHNYGGRGITICERWDVGTTEMHPFTCFLRDMGKRPSSKYSLNRSDNNGNYEPSNCEWVTAKVQCNNKRNSVVWKCFGKAQTVAEWAKDVSLRVGTLRQRVDLYGWSIERALTEPLQSQFSHLKK